MGILTDDMKRVVTEQRLGFVATVDADGTPNLSPKGTMVVLDDDHILFGDLRSPGTIGNLRANPAVEVNFVDPFARTGYRFKGTAAYVARDEADFGDLHALFAHWGALAEGIKGIVRIKVERALPLSSPAYDYGATEAELRAQWAEHFETIGPTPGGRVDDA
jgi:predicted pyridoxine 5'-phosphate oxidase superfamily flavin-nucleotide-binding protein